MVSHIYIESDAVLCLMPNAVRLNITLRMPSGETIQSWRNTPPYIHLSELRIPGARKSYKILKQTRIIEDHHEIWQEGDGEVVELTMVKCCEQYLILHVYLCLRIEDDYTAIRFPATSVTVSATSHRVPARQGLGAFYEQLLSTSDEAAHHLVALLREDLRATQVLRRDFLQFTTGKNEGHLGNVKAVLMLDSDNRFCLRMKTEFFLLIDDPTPRQLRLAKEMILELPLGDV